jgi:hypothetical protein
MKGITLWMLLGTFLVIGTILLKEQPSEATDFNDSSAPANNTGVLIKEEKEEDEINATTPTDIEGEQLANTSAPK